MGGNRDPGRVAAGIPEHRIRVGDLQGVAGRRIKGAVLVRHATGERRRQRGGVAEHPGVVAGFSQGNGLDIAAVGVDHHHRKALDGAGVGVLVVVVHGDVYVAVFQVSGLGHTAGIGEFKLQSVTSGVLTLMVSSVVNSSWSVLILTLLCDGGRADIHGDRNVMVENSVGGITGIDSPASSRG